MGCDIHTVIERKRKNDTTWIGVVSSDELKGRPDYARRDYDFFAEVANVRGSTKGGHYPKNLPEDISELAWQEYMSSPTDHHSASYMSVEQFCAIYNEVNPGTLRAEYAVYDLLGLNADESGGPEYRVVFWFDN